MEKSQLKIIISGGGTGGHIFPAIAIADAICQQRPGTDILFVGALGRMEMERVPKAGYRIVGLPVMGFQRKHLFKNVEVIIKLLASMRRARRLIRTFRPDVAVGVGGFASGPIVRAAQQMRIPTLLQEQNSYAGVTNRMLAKRASTICVAYNEMDRFFPAQKLMLTGNPIRHDLENLTVTRREAREFFGIPNSHRVVLVIGGSLGARTVNQSVMAAIDKIEQQQNLTVIWQTGRLYHQDILRHLQSRPPLNIKVFDFLNRMDLAYTAADLVISRAGAGTISELCLVAKPAILVPSPNVAEDHQTRNANALVNKNAAVLVNDADAMQTLVNEAITLVNDEQRLESLAKNVAKLALPNSAKIIANEVLKLCNVLPN